MINIFTRSRSLLVIVALAMIVAMSTVTTARASSPGPASAAGVRNTDAASNAACNLNYTAPSCESTNPTVTLSTYAYGNLSGCIFNWEISWGDGNTTTVPLFDLSDGWKVTAQHTYAAARTYYVIVMGTETGPCTLSPFNVTFTLVAPTSSASPPDYYCSCVTYVRDTLAAQGVKLGGGSAYGFADDYTEKGMAALGWRRVKPPNNGNIPDGNQPMVMVWDAKTHGAGSMGHMAIVVNAWARNNLDASGKSPWYNFSTKRWNITVLQDDWSEDPNNCTPAQHLFNNAYQHWGELYGVNFYVPDN